MAFSNQEKIYELIHESKEVKIKCSDEFFRLDLDLDNIRLWRGTLKRYKESYNLLLACESNDCNLNKTKLTWVVGSAIRAINVKSAHEASQILESLGISNNLACKLKNHCPGLGDEIAWAFYLDRHGTLSASPIIPLESS